VFILTQKVRAGQVQDRPLYLNFRPGVPGILSVTEWASKKLVQTHYFVWPLPSDWGKAVRLEKFAADGGETYDVLLDGEQSSCECHGFLRWGRCKHVAAAQSLQERGEL
jgi:hypothetical protein